MSKIMIIGDLHVSDVYSGKHKNFLENCIECIDMITEEIEKQKPDYLILTGDLIGRKEKTLKMRETLLWMMKVLQQWKSLVKSNKIYSIRGNHDSDGNLTDFDIFISLGLIDPLDSLDIDCVRLHGVDFGCENKVLDIRDSAFNVAIAHNNFQVEGVTTWFRGGKISLELSSLHNWKGIDFVASGHIHEPSIKLVETAIQEHPVSLFYLGNPTRPNKDNKWDQCHILYFDTDGDDVNISHAPLKLKPWQDIFATTYDDIVEDEEDVKNSVIDIEQLSSILEELQTYNFNSVGDIKSQLYRLAGLDKEAADLAMGYIEEVERDLK